MLLLPKQKMQREITTGYSGPIIWIGMWSKTVVVELCLLLFVLVSGFVKY